MQEGVELTPEQLEHVNGGAILIGMLMPAIQKVRDTSRSSDRPAESLSLNFTEIK